MHKIKGFTLSEVLLVLSVIGVVAALTIPTLVQKIGTDQNKASWKKAYSVISQSATMLTNDNGGNISNLCAGNNSVCVRQKLGNYMNMIKTCDGANNSDPLLTPCWAATGVGTNTGESKSVVLLADGSSFMFDYEYTPCNTTTNACYIVDVDVNGPKPPNSIGADIFYAYVYSDGSVKPAGGACSNGTAWGCSTDYLYQ